MGCEGHRLLENPSGRGVGYLFTTDLCASLNLQRHAIHPKPKVRTAIVKGERLRVLQTITGVMGHPLSMQREPNDNIP